MHNSLKKLKNFLRRKVTQFFRGGYFAINELDKKLESFMPYRNGFYVELGANNGYDQSNSYYFELKKGWRGVLVEPLMNKYTQCINIRGRKNKVHNNACVPFGFYDEYVEIYDANLMSVSLIGGDLSNIENHLNEAKDSMNEVQVIDKIKVKAKTLNEILIESKAPNIIDFLSLDVEGSEIQVLKGIDHSKFRFKYILVETRSFHLISSFLESNSYNYIQQLSELDYLFKLENLT